MTVPVRVTLTALGVVPVQLGRFDVAVMQFSAVVVPVTVTFDGGLALFQDVTAALTVARVELLANMDWAIGLLREAGFDEHLVKPVHAEQLLRLLGEMRNTNGASRVRDGNAGRNTPEAGEKNLPRQVRD